MVFSIVNPHQSAYCKYHSTETALLYIHDHLVSAIGSHRSVKTREWWGKQAIFYSFELQYLENGKRYGQSNY